MKALPKAAKDYIVASTKALDCDPTLLATPLLPILAAAIGNAVRVEIKPTWVEPCILWAIVISKSGTMKSPAIDAMMKPVNRLEALRKEAFREELAEFNKLEKEERKKKVKPTRDRLKVNDITIETLAMVHSDNPRGLLLARDEVAAWWASFNKYSRGESDLHCWIEFYEGRYVTIDRKSNDVPTLDIKSPCVSVIGGVQPGVLEKTLQPAYFYSGFEPRLLFVEPPENVPDWSDATVHPDVRDAYYELVESLYNISMGRESHVLPLSSKAKDAFKEFVRECKVITEQLPDGPLRSRMAKLKAIAARIALIFQLCHDPGSVEVKGFYVERAIEVAKWFWYEALRVHQKAQLCILDDE